MISPVAASDVVVGDGHEDFCFLNARPMPRWKSLPS